MTGAGISVDSGLPTYRGVGGLYDGPTPEGLPIEVILSGPMLHKDPALCWQYMGHIEQACRGARPNRAHEVVAALQDHMEVVVLTQNVDGLHRRAGSREVIEIHGDLSSLMCTACGWREPVQSLEGVALPPRCPACGAVARPPVVLFGEPLPRHQVDAMMRARSTPFDVVFTVGTSSLFPYITDPVVAQLQAGRVAVEINPGDTVVSPIVTHHLRGGAADVLGELWRRLEQP